MAIQQIQYDDKEAINIDSAVPDKNKCKADDLNEIKSVVNNNSYETPKVSSQVDTDYKVNVLTTKNLFNKDNANILNAYFDNNVPITSDNGTRVIYIPCKENTTYTISKAQSNRFRVGYTTELPTTNTSVSGVISNNSATSIKITTGNNATYIVAFVWINSDTLTLNQVLDSIQIEEGSTATTYEAFIPNTINVNNEKYTDTINVGTSINDKNRVNILYSKNLFDKETTPIFNGYINDDGSITANASNRILYIPIEDNKTYTIQKEVGNSPRFRISLTDDVPANNLSGYSFVKDDNANTLSITNTTHKYLCVWYWTSASTTTETEIKGSIIIQEGNTIITPSINVDGEEIYNAGKDIITAGFSSDYVLATTNTYVDVPLNTTYSQIGTNFEINNGEIICKKDGYIKVSCHFNYLYIAGTGSKWITISLYHTYYNSFITINITGTQNERADISGTDRLVYVYAGDKLKIQNYGTQNDTLRAAYSYMTCEYV